MAPPIQTHGDKAYLSHPWGGVEAVPVGEVGEALKLGYQPASPEQVDQVRLEEHCGTAGQQALTALEGAGRGVSLGLSDFLLPDKLAAKHRRDVNPTLAGGTEFVGGVGGMFIPGGPMALLAKGAGKAGQAGARLAARATTREPLQRAAGLVAREATFGAGFGAGHGLSDVAIEDLHGTEAGKRVLSALAMGGATGAGLGVLAFGGHQAGKAVRKKLTYGFKDARIARENVLKLQAEKEAALAAGTPEEALVGLDAQIASGVRVQQEANSKVVGKVFARAVGAGIGVGLDYGLTGGILGTIIAPRLLKGFKGALRPGGTLAEALPGFTAFKKMGRMAEKLDDAQIVLKSLEQDPLLGQAVRQARERAENETGRKIQEAAQWAGEKVGQGVKTVAGKVPVGHLGELGAESLGHAVGEGAAIASAMGPELALSGFAQGGMTGLLLGLAAHKSKAQIAKIGDLALNKIVPAVRMKALGAMTEEDYSEVAEELPHINTDSLDAGILATVPEGTPPALVQGMQGKVLTAIKFLQDNHPARGQAEQAIPVKGQSTRQPSQQEQESYQRLVKSVINPDELIKGIMAGNLRREHLQAWQAVYPEALAQLRQVVRAEVAQVKAHGGMYEPRQAKLIAAVLGEPESKPKIYDKRRMQMWQAAHQASKEQPGPKPRPRNVSGYSASAMTPAQRLQT